MNVLSCRSAEDMATFCEERFDVSVPLSFAERLVRTLPRKGPQLATSWIRNQLDEEGYFYCASPVVSDEPADPFATTFHVFFLSLEETPDMLCLLRKKDCSERREAWARSKIGRTILEIHPVDWVAFRVSRPWPNKSEVE